MCSRALACPLRWCTSLRAAQASAALMTWSRLVRPMDVVSNPCMQQQRQLRDVSNTVWEMQESSRCRIWLLRPGCIEKYL